jgi:hypothetical protein
MASKSKWLMWASSLGAFSLVVGLVWLGIWSYLLRASKAPDWITLELRPPLGARAMIAAGVVTLVTTSITALIRKLRAIRN